MREPELTLMSRLADAKKEVRKCLCDDFDTPGAVGALQELVKAVNKVRAQKSPLFYSLSCFLWFAVAGVLCFLVFVGGAGEGPLVRFVSRNVSSPHLVLWHSWSLR